MTVGESIKQCRINKGLTQKQLAEMLGLAEITIRQYENGKRQLKIETLIRLSRALNVDIDDLADTGEQAAIDIREHPEKWGTSKKAFCKERIDFALKKLNSTGHEEAAKRIEEMTKIPRYTKPDEPQE